MKRYLLCCYRAVWMMPLILAALPGRAQLKGDHMLGDAGLQSGTQPPASLTVLVPLYFYNANTFKNSEGHTLNQNPDVNMFVTGVGASFVSNFKVLGANWGATLLLPFASNKVDGSLVYSKSSIAYSDTYVQPVQLGWHIKQADFVAGYALYLPTGKYSVGGDDNSGLGQLCNEFSGGATVYFNSKKTWNLSSLLSYSLYGKKKDSDIRTGDQLSIEGGLGKTIYKPVPGSPLPMIFNMGLVYYMQFKTTSDQIPIGDALVFNGSGDHIYGLGLEGNVFLPRIHSSIGIRWVDEFDALNRFQGNTFFITLAPYVKFLARK